MRNSRKARSPDAPGKSLMQRKGPPQLPLRRGNSGSSILDDKTEHTEECTIMQDTSSQAPLAPTRRVNVLDTPTIIPPPRTLLLNRDSITAMLHDFYDDLNSNAQSKSRECWKAFYETYHSPSYQMVRPSGNPLQSHGFIDMFCSQDVELLGFELVSIDSVQILAGGIAAVAIYTVDQRFTYKGNLNEDRVMLTCVVEELNGDIRICHEHRSTGQPIPKQSRWESNCQGTNKSASKQEG